MNNEFSYSIQDTSDGLLNQSKLYEEIFKSNIIIGVESIVSSSGGFTIKFKANISTLNIQTLNTIVSNHVGVTPPKAKILNMVAEEIRDIPYTDIDYTIAPQPNLHPKRTFIQGELQKVEWYADPSFDEIVLEVNISYTRDTFGFATSRITERIWYDEFGEELNNKKITTKDYTINSVEQIKEGKRRRGNIIDGIQLPTLSFMVETMTVAPWNLSAGAVLLMGRDFMDRHETYFSKFVDNSSSVVDFNDPNFGKKSVVVAIELAAVTTDTWLKNTPSQLGGMSIEQYLISEFSI